VVKVARGKFTFWSDFSLRQFAAVFVWPPAFQRKSDSKFNDDARKEQSMNPSSMKRNVLVCLAIFLLSAMSVSAQTGTSAIGGAVTDQQGKAVPGAKVTLTNVATNATRTVEATNTGAYICTAVQIS
jgi:hypothetical protein